MPASFLYSSFRLVYFCQKRHGVSSVLEIVYLFDTTSTLHVFAASLSQIFCGHRRLFECVDFGSFRIFLRLPAGVHLAKLLHVFYLFMSFCFKAHHFMFDVLFHLRWLHKLDYRCPPSRRYHVVFAAAEFLPGYSRIWLLAHLFFL